MLKDLSNDTLLAKVKALVAQEKELVVQLIEYLKEIEMRQLFLEKGYPSMFEFATKYLGLSEFEAHTRIQAARLTQAIPEVTEKILNGELSLSVAAQTQAQFRREDQRRRKEGEKPMRREEKRAVLDLVENCSRREAEEKLSVHFGQQSDLKEYSFLASRELQADLDKVMDEISHVNFGRDLGKLVELLVKEKIAQIEKKKNGPPKAKGASYSRKNPGQTKPQPSEVGAAPQMVRRKAQVSARVRISIQTKREVWKRTGARCDFVDPKTGNRCCSTHALEFDHILPLSKGGTDEPANLTILCDAHNRWKGATEPRGP